MRRQVLFFASATLTVLLAGSASRANLIVNGDFELGNVGFSSGYTFSPANVYDVSTYDIARNPINDNQYFTSYGDHTSGFGYMMVISGSTDPNVTVWSETVTVAAGTKYDFSFFGSSCYPSSPARLEVLFNGISLGIFTLPVSSGTWQGYGASWYSGATTSVTIEIIDRNLDFSGNDFALDELALQGPNAVPEPSGFTLLAVGPACLIGCARRWNRKLRPCGGPSGK
jgi:hypothetical protein